jgi:hypothetical protein
MRAREVAGNLADSVSTRHAQELAGRGDSTTPDEESIHAGPRMHAYHKPLILEDVPVPEPGDVVGRAVMKF